MPRDDSGFLIRQLETAWKLAKLSSIAWITWHMGFWWSMILDHSFGTATLSRHRVEWPGDADRAREWIYRLHGDWRDAIAQLTDDDLRSEIGYARFLYAVGSP